MLAPFASPFAYALGQGYVGPLDLVPNAAAAYSVARKLRAAYTGPLVRLRRSADNTESDFYPRTDGSLDTAAVAAFVSAGSGFVTKLYDQSVNGRDAVQATAANQPLYVASAQGGRAGALYDGSNDLLAANTVASVLTGTDVAATLIGVANFTGTGNNQRAWSAGRSTAGQPFFDLAADTTPNWAFERRDDANTYKAVAAGTPGSTFAVVSTVFTGTVGSLFVNGTQAGSDTNMDVGATTLDRFAIGALLRGAASNWWVGHICELLVYPSALTAGRATIEANAKAYHGTP